ncbi:ThiS, thiamine-biosynthesis [mine drainage metagenome]|uniref:ThiS, thiamine-biosynthesis n=1 Tax=mine drainage metagenome TaxID=410659 RepID=T1BRD3_9ZZZZ
MRVLLNGESREIGETLTVAELLATLDLGSGRMALECNGAIVPRSEYGRRRIADGDVIEIIHAVGGG